MSLNPLGRCKPSFDMGKTVARLGLVQKGVRKQSRAIKSKSALPQLTLLEQLTRSLKSCNMIVAGIVSRIVASAHPYPSRWLRNEAASPTFQKQAGQLGLIPKEGQSAPGCNRHLAVVFLGRQIEARKILELCHHWCSRKKPP